MTRASSPRRSPGPPRGILRSLAPDGTTTHHRVAPRADLAPFIEHFWSVTWSLRTPLLVETLPHPTVHLVFEECTSEGARISRAELTGVPSRRFTRQLVGDGRVFGIKFRPAAFQPVWGGAMVELRDRVLPLDAALGSAAEALHAGVARALGIEDAADHVESILLAILPPMPREVGMTRDLAERMASDHALLRAEDAAREAGLDERTLQRRFRRHVGVTPKWVIRRYRLHEAAERLKGPSAPSIAALAAELGYFDQAHFAREFKLVVGRTPREFAAMEGGDRAL